MSIPSLVRYTLATASVLILSITSTNYAHALDNQSTIGITLSSPKLELPKLTTSKFYTVTTQTIAVTTNNELGYALSLSSKDNETDLVNKAKNQTIKTTNGTLDTPSTLTENTWGTKELNGLWVGKFEMTGKRTAPTVRPNEATSVWADVGSLYTMAKSIGVNDPDNVYGGSVWGGNGSERDMPAILPDNQRNQHNLKIANSHMIKNSEWGAIEYLTASKYGASVAAVKANASSMPTGVNDSDGDYASWSAVTGCGPTTDDREGVRFYESSYSDSVGQLAATTHNVYEIYDMSGIGEYVMGDVSATAEAARSPYDASSYTLEVSAGKYVDIYRTDITPKFDATLPWGRGYGRNNIDVCTWQSCGGHRLGEVAVNTNSGDGYYNTPTLWGGSIIMPSSGYPWFVRGGVGAHYERGRDENKISDIIHGKGDGYCMASRAILTTQ